jgi:SAM-dependent methyltransferase
MPEHDWNARYAEGTLPWDTGTPDEHLVAAVRAGLIAPARALEIGCGTGTNALWLAAQGFDVLGVDVSPLAIEQARGKATAASAQHARFEVVDFLSATPAGAPFDFVFDRGCFHIFDDDGVRARFAARAAALLAPGGQWLSLVGSTEGPPRAEGPPRRSAREVMAAIEPVPEIVELRSVYFEALIESPARAWFCRARAREVPAQPSTHR